MEVVRRDAYALARAAMTEHGWPYFAPCRRLRLRVCVSSGRELGLSGALSSFPVVITDRSN
jgi:hypothetical protein